ncbi:MAG: sulfite exporter TauE/SafE family protein [Chitinophagales bacterium]|nr:sulfite exporter TauE/SafE family protein [Chitinophagales bacterium]
MILIIGYILSFLTGAVINLLGGGGSIMTVPILVYLFKVDPYLATSYSMFLVGISSWLATIDNAKKKMIIYKLAIVFAIPDLIVTYVIRKFLLPILPNIFFTYENITVTKQSVIMLIFAGLMIVASVNSLRSKKAPSTVRPIKFNYPLIIVQGMLVGLVTGLVGAGGGFLIIPAFVISSRVPMNIAIYTSSLVIAISTTIGFLGDFNPELNIDWRFLLVYTFITIAGVFAINPFKKKIGNQALRKTFGYMIFVLSLVIFYIEFSKLGGHL